MHFANFTPHSITVINKKNEKETLESVGEIRLVEEKQKEINIEDSQFIIRSVPEYTGVTEFDEEKIQCKNLIVSMPVGLYLKQYTGILNGYNIYGPDSSPSGCIRQNGQIVAVKNLIKYR
jgi:hypothetical protein